MILFLDWIKLHQIILDSDEGRVGRGVLVKESGDCRGVKVGANKENSKFSMFRG